jgi:hypothetical protein
VLRPERPIIRVSAGVTAIEGIAVCRGEGPVVAEALDEIGVGDERFAKGRKVDQSVLDKPFRLCQIEAACQNKCSRIARGISVGSLRAWARRRGSPDP